jgi:hypothetical protein
MHAVSISPGLADRVADFASVALGEHVVVAQDVLRSGTILN